MKFWTSGEIQADVGDNYRKIMNEIEEKVNTLLQGKCYGDSLEKWVFIPIIRRIDSPQFGEVKKYSPRNKTVEFRLKINYGDYKEASFERRREHCFRTAVVCTELMPLLKIPNFNALELKKDLITFGIKEGWVLE